MTTTMCCIAIHANKETSLESDKKNEAVIHKETDNYLSRIPKIDPSVNFRFVAVLIDKMEF